MHKDFVLGSATLALAAAYYLMAAAIPQSQLADAIGPQGLPKVYAILLAGLSLILIVRSLTRRQLASRSVSEKREHAPSRPASPATTRAIRSMIARGAQGSGAQRQALWRVTGMLAIGVVYMLVVPWLGYILSLAGLIFATTYYQGGTVNRQVAVVAVSGAVFFWLLFVILLRIPQPAGLWPSLL